MIEIQNLCVQYEQGILALDHVSLQVSPGEQVALIGANGAGKSTLLLSMMEIVPKISGSISIDHIDVTKRNQTHIFERVGFVFQNPDDQLFMPTVEEDVAFGPRHFLKDANDIKQRVDQAVSFMKIEDLLTRPSHRLSGGEKRRVALASVLAMQPPLLLLDEPAAFLDPRARCQLIHTLNHLPMTKIMATHDLDMALDTCQRVILLWHGNIMADGLAKTILKDENLLHQCGLELPIRYQSLA